MAAINDLISQIQDETLRNRIQEEVSKMAKQKKFGLVFEEHMPESTPLGSFFKISIHSSLLNSCLNLLILRNIDIDSLSFI